MDQNQTTYHMLNKTQIQQVEMETKKIGPQKLQLFIVERTKRERNIPTLKSTTRYLPRRI